jgi:hypothetical protein
VHRVRDIDRPSTVRHIEIVSEFLNLLFLEYGVEREVMVPESLFDD